ncbi:MAG: cation transporter, partial [Acidobacteria bacterium]|nr:cation transporter [Acidobacteriota bacterium]
HMRASWIFSKNDVIANLGIILSGVLVIVLGSRFPDLLIGTAIASIVIRGGCEILREASAVKEKAIGA